MQRGNGDFVVNEFESFEALITAPKRFEEPAHVWIRSYWLSVLNSIKA
jgi:hypothetical protein